jgi:hypothetical protein
MRDFNFNISQVKQRAKARRDRKAAAINEQRWRETMARNSHFREEMENFFKQFGLRL